MPPGDAHPNYRRHLVLGGARSGKSSFAERTALAVAGGPAIYIATAAALDDEMHQRIEHHRATRDDRDWTVIEEPVDLAKVLDESPVGATILIDCLTLWLSNCLHADSWPDQRSRFLDALDPNSRNVVLVSNEVGLGVVPLGELTREFVDDSGRLHQDVAARCDEVTLIVAGLPHRLKPQS